MQNVNRYINNNYFVMFRLTAPPLAKPHLSLVIPKTSHFFHWPLSLLKKSPETGGLIFSKKKCNSLYSRPWIFAKWLVPSLRNQPSSVPISAVRSIQVILWGGSPEYSPCLGLEPPSSGWTFCTDLQVWNATGIFFGLFIR